MLYENCLNAAGLLIILAAIINFRFCWKSGVASLPLPRTVSGIYLVTVFIWLSGFISRWSDYVSQTSDPWFYAFPVVTKYETLAFALFLVVFLTYFVTHELLRLRSLLWFTGGLGLLFLNFIYSPETPANFVPSLKSNWLVVHISLSFLAYAMFAVAAGINGYALVTDHCQRISGLSERLIACGTVLFTIGGIFIGAIWADQSWGRFWAWDPKESWAFVTWVIYSALWHTFSIGRMSSKVRSMLIVIAFGVILFTYFGVNALYLESLHSYSS